MLRSVLLISLIFTSVALAQIELVTPAPLAPDDVRITVKPTAGDSLSATGDSLSTRGAIFVELLWVNNFSKVPIFLGYTWEWVHVREDEPMSEANMAMSLELAVDRIAWGRMSDYDKDQLVTAAYQGLEENLMRLFSGVRYRPALKFVINEPHMGKMELAVHNGAEYWFR